MRRRILVNPEKIDWLIAGWALVRPVELALKALRRPLLNAHELYSRVTEMPSRDAPDWLTEELIAQGNVYKLDMRRVVEARETGRKINDIHVWLVESRLHLKHATQREQRKWHARLGHIPTLDGALMQAAQDRARWRKRAALRDQKRRRAIEGNYRATAGLASELEATGEIIRTCVCPDGKVWFELTSDRAQWHEGVLMRSRLRDLDCRSGLRREGWRLFSLRADVNAPCLTAQVHATGRWIATRSADRPMTVDDLGLLAILLGACGQARDWRSNFFLLPEERGCRQHPNTCGGWIAVMDALKAA